ncbi:MAG: hypothetical protein STSR0008_20380 [Ignavibacterium sp.]
MKGRQSVNPLNKLGFSIAREGSGSIIITELGNKFLAGDYDIGYIFFKSLLKLQFPNPWSADFSGKEGFNIMPFVGVMQLIHKTNKKSTKRGLDKTEFSIFIPTLINYNQIDEYVERILEFRKEKNKDRYILNFAKEFYEAKKVPDKKINNLFDYGDNIMKYFRLTRYFKVSMDPLGYYWNIDIEPSRKVEVEQLLDMYSGETLKFKTLEDYLHYLSDITKPSLPWEKKENLEKVAQSLKNIIFDLIKRENIQISQDEQKVFLIDVQTLSKTKLEDYISRLRSFNLDLKEKLKKTKLMSDLGRVEEIILTLQNSKKVKKYEPEQFEKLITEALKIINDEILIKPNYPMDDNGEPINHSPGNKPDIECYYLITWYKTNAMPNITKRTFTHSTEYVCWFVKGNNWNFNYERIKDFNPHKTKDGKPKQLRDFVDFIEMPIVQGKERIKGQNGRATHPTQKPERLIELIILASSNEDDLILDPFFGTGTTGVVASRLKRNWIGIEINEKYFKIAYKRIFEKEVIINA